MRIDFHLTGTERKALVRAVSEIIGAEAVYKYAPTFNYQIDCFTVTKDGALEFDDKADNGKVKSLLDGLSKQGFIATETPCNATENNSKKLSETNENKPHGENVGLTVAVPTDSVNTENLTALLSVKGELIKKALGTDSLDFEIVGDRVSFNWFQNTDIENADTYTKFISALCKMSKDQKRINKTESNAENEKYAFRCFLLRLGFIGNEYKNDRKVLLKNLTGSSAFKTVKGATDNEIS